MTSTYDNDLRLNEMATGDQSGAWGTVTNLNLEMIAEAFSYGTRAIANASTDNITLADGALDADRSMYLKLTGGGQACTVTFLPATISKVWLIENATSATLTFTQGSNGANVAVLAGQVKMIATDGGGSTNGVVYDLLTDVNLAGTTVTDNLTVGGNIDLEGNIDVNGTTNLDAVDIDGAVQIDATVNVGVDDTGYDVKFFGDTASAYMQWDASADDLILGGAAGLVVPQDKLTIASTAVTSTAAELNQLDAITRGSILYGNASGATARLAKGGANTVLTSDGTDISWVAASGGGEATFTATGAISAGNPVGFNANGTISAMPQMSGSAAALGSGASSTGGGRQPMAYDTAADKYLHVFSGTNDNLFARVGTVSGFSISFGTAVDSGTTLNAYARTRGLLHLVYDDNAGKFVVSYCKSDGKGYARTITISGTTPSFGTEVNVYSYTTYHTEVGYDSNANKVVFLNAGNQDSLRGRVGTISGTDISLGTEVDFSGTAMYPMPGSLAFDTNVNKFIFVYGTSNYARPYKARTISISGTSASAGTEVTLASSGDYNVAPNIVFDPSINKGVALFSENGPKFKLLTISGTDLTQGTTTLIPLATTPVIGITESFFSSCVDPDTAGIVMCYCTGVAETRITPAKFSGSDMTLSGEVVVSTTKKQGGIIYDPDADATIVSTIDEAQVVKSSVRPSYVGVAAESISNGATGKVTIIGGVNANQSSLSAGTQYGIPASSASLVATDTSPIGIAISSTQIYLRAVSL